MNVLEIRERIDSAVEHGVEVSRSYSAKDFDENGNDLIITRVVVETDIRRMAPPKGRLRLVAEGGVEKVVLDVPVRAIHQMGYAREYMRLRDAVRKVLSRYNVDIPELSLDRPALPEFLGGLLVESDPKAEILAFQRCLGELRDAAADQSELWSLMLPYYFPDNRPFRIELVDAENIDTVIIHGIIARPVV